MVWQPGTSLHRPAPAAADRRTVVIVRARYGADAGWLDVTTVIGDAVRRGPGRRRRRATPRSAPTRPQNTRSGLRSPTQSTASNSPDRVGENGTWAPSDLGGCNCFGITGSGNLLEFVVGFSSEPLAGDLPGPAETVAAAAAHWPAFWRTGGAIDFSASTDPRWVELERRVVLSQYLMAVNEAGDWPPQESGLVNTGWFGKFHMEMYWWHAAHYAVWNRWPVLDRSTGVYERMMDTAKARAVKQGYRGARWTKMTGPDGPQTPRS